ncbi:MAG: sigma 54-interacting transcriptional regulator, partial [Polyangiaceae bacterium]|nr:sigma 54-interacting transcriptional regulator [Polyangiaceae bacterium]
GELPLELQPKLLRLLENREVQPVGAERPHKVDVLLIAATNRDLAAMVEAGTFRRDLLARLTAAVVELPPLRDRIEDLFAVLSTLASARGETLAPESVEIEAVERLLLEGYPANVRDLASVLARVRVIDAEPGLRMWSLQEVLGRTSTPSGRALTKERVEQVLAETAGNESEAARRLGVSRGALRRFLAQRG